MLFFYHPYVFAAPTTTKLLSKNRYALVLSYEYHTCTRYGCIPDTGNSLCLEYPCFRGDFIISMQRCLISFLNACSFDFHFFFSVFIWFKLTQILQSILICHDIFSIFIYLNRVSSTRANEEANLPSSMRSKWRANSP